MLRTEHSTKINLTFITASLVMMLFITGCVQKKITNPKAGQPYTNSIGMAFVPIPGNEYSMQTTEVTIGQWFKVMKEPISWKPESTKDDPQCPITGVSHWEIIEFINRLNALEGTVTYRLPNRWEWANACVAGTTTRWYFGNNEEKLKDNAWFFDNARGDIQRVGQKKPNPLGLYDMYGNVMEFTSTCGARYTSDTFILFGEKNPERCKCYILKGGSAFSTVKQMTHAGTYCNLMGAGDSIGFRLVMDHSVN